MKSLHDAEKSFSKRYGKITSKFLIDYIKTISKKSGLTYEELQKMREDALFYLALRYVPASKKTVAVAFELTLETMCWRKRQLEDLNRLWVVRLDRCPVTGENGVQILTTDERLKPKNPQLELFAGGGLM